MFPFGEFFKACKVSHRRFSAGITTDQLKKKHLLTLSALSAIFKRRIMLHKLQSDEKLPVNYVNALRFRLSRPLIMSVSVFALISQKSYFILFYTIYHIVYKST